MSRDSENRPGSPQDDAADDADRDESHGPVGGSPPINPASASSSAPINPVSGRGSSASAAAALATEDENLGDDRPCLILGPMQSGKTALLLALSRACYLPGEDNLHLEFVPEAATALLMKDAVNIITKVKEGPLATASEQRFMGVDFPFWIYASTQRTLSDWRPVRASIRMVVSDGPGGALFTAENLPLTVGIEAWQRHLIPAGRRARTLVLCVDATKPSADVLQAYFPELVAKMCSVEVIRETEPWRYRMLQKLRLQDAPAVWTRRKMCLNADRFLLLLTKVDQLCASLPEPERFASLIDPVVQARELLGVSFLNMIQSALKPGASFAAGVTSAWGFDPDTKEPFAGSKGKPGKLSAETGEEILRRWTPFGIRDAIFFIATGRDGGTVKRICREDLLSLRGNPPIEFTYKEQEQGFKR